MTKLPVYKKNVVTNKYIQVGTVDDYGFIELYESLKRSPDGAIGNCIPQTFYSEFYTDYETKRVVQGGRERKNDKGEVIGIKTISIGSYISSIDKKVFIPKNLPTQLISLKESTFLESKDYYVTGYVDNDGMAVYYDQYL